MKKIDKKIGERAKKSKNTRPVEAFITFNTEEDVNAAIEGAGFERACEPTDILWENRMNSKDKVWMKAIGANVLILIVLYIFFRITWGMRSSTADIFEMFPEVDCT